MDLRHCKGRIVKLFLKRKRDKVQEDTGRAVPLYRSIQRQKNGQRPIVMGKRFSYLVETRHPRSLESSGKGLARLTFEVSVSK